MAADFTTLINAIGPARSAFLQPAFTYSGVVAPAVGGQPLAAHVTQLREVLK